MCLQWPSAFKPCLAVLVVRQILQRALVVRGRNLRCLPANFLHRSLVLSDAPLPFMGMHEVVRMRRAGDAVGGWRRVGFPLPCFCDKWAWCCAAQRLCRPDAQSFLCLLQRVENPLSGLLLLSIFRFHAPNLMPPESVCSSALSLMATSENGGTHAQLRAKATLVALVRSIFRPYAARIAVKSASDRSRRRGYSVRVRTPGGNSVF